MASVSNNDDPVLRLKNNLVNIWKTSEYSDLLIRCNNGDEHRVHRVILCSQSEFFRRACNPKTGFKVHQPKRGRRRRGGGSSRGRSNSTSSTATTAVTSTTSTQTSSPTHHSSLAQEALSGVIELRHDDPATVRAMLEFCYTFTYTCPTSSSSSSSSHPSSSSPSRNEDAMIFHVHMYAVGEIYDIPSLKALAARNFDRDVDHAFPRFPAAVRAIYETTPDSDRGLRDRALRVCAAHAAELLANPAFEDVMDQLGVFGKEFARQLVANGSAAGAAGAGAVKQAPTKTVVVDCRRYRCGKRLIKPDDPPEPEDVIERPSSVAGEDGGPAGW
ncbi:BTB/POZ domain containing protein [Lasiodiplodia theobromae]|uniref:BTB/POZ domain containing protein n=1 Tax=Lasiodiplodia theobromae TaxID=45133 RepID=UPI0015C349CA|nr:BTB/POZ domain containing protein [Lasiodiplodia theobromae]KAF4541509.1 BTB/POZ domain containing protein [Lasiodiplodia theobromae]